MITFVCIINKVFNLLFFMSLLCILNYAFRIVKELYSKEIKPIIFSKTEIWYIAISLSYVLSSIFNGIKL